MIVLGINSGATKNGRPLNDGGACLVKDGEVIVAIQEERITRKKYDCGFENSIRYVCEYANVDFSQIDYVVVSSCIDYVWSLEDAMTNLKLQENYGFDKRKVIVLGHHLSHAYCGFISSGFREALVCVLDNMGNKTSGKEDSLWNGGFERNSYYKAYWQNGKPKIELIDKEADTPDQIGYGEAFRYFTHYFGWDSYKHAGKTMGLSAYGNPETFGSAKLFETNENKEMCLLGSLHNEPEIELKKFFLKLGIDIPRKLEKNEPVTQYYADMAFFLQREFEVSLLRKVKYLVKKTGLNKIVISGGVALNCLANYLILNLKNIKDVYVPSAPGDEGQALGNALFGYYSKAYTPYEPSTLRHAYFGKDYNDNSWKEYALSKGLKLKKKREIENETAKLLSKGKIIGWFQSRSEFGPRALGHRSILADPRFDYMKEIVNSRIKFRELFRPFAPSFLEEYQKEYFENTKIKSYFMSFAPPIIANKQRYVPAITHLDGTARLQTVSKSIDERYHKLIDEFRKITGVPCILNTSFNLNDEPIVETPLDAINTFLRCNLDCLVIGDYLILKSIKDSLRQAKPLNMLGNAQIQEGTNNTNNCTNILT